MSIDGWMDKEIISYIYTGILFSHIKEEILPSVITWVNIEGIVLSEIRQTLKDKYYVISLMCRV